MWGCSTLFHFSQLMLFNISGDIHLLRVKSDLPLSTPVSVDYGLKDWCTGNVNLRFYDGTHESFLQQDDGESVAKDIMEIVRESSCWICLQANVWQCIVLIYGHWIYSWRFFLLKINWSVKALFCFKFEIVYFFPFVWGLSSHSRIFHSYGDVTITTMTSKNFDLYSALMAIEQWIFDMPYLLWHGPTLYNGHLRGPVTHTLVAERFGSGTGTTWSVPTRDPTRASACEVHALPLRHCRDLKL